MQVVTCRVGGSLRPGENTRIVIHRRQGERVVLGVTAPAGTELIFDGAAIQPMSGTAGTSSFLFSLQAIRRFAIGRFEVCVWLPGEFVPLAADCESWLHVGITLRRSCAVGQTSTRIAFFPGLSAPVADRAATGMAADSERPAWLRRGLCPGVFGTEGTTTCSR